MRIFSLLFIVLIAVAVLGSLGTPSLDELSKPKGLTVGADCEIVHTGEQVSLVSIKGDVAHVLHINGIMDAVSTKLLNCTGDKR